MEIKNATANMGYQQITSLNAAVGLTVPGKDTNGIGPKLALLQAQTQNVRWRDDGTNPTASVGMILYAGADPYPYDGDLSKIKFIEVAASAALNISYYY